MPNTTQQLIEELLRETETVHVGIISYNPKSGKVVFICPLCGGKGTVYSSRGASYSYDQICFTCDGNKYMSFVVSEEDRKTIREGVKNARKSKKITNTP